MLSTRASTTIRGGRPWESLAPRFLGWTCTGVDRHCGCRSEGGAPLRARGRGWARAGQGDEKALRGAQADDGSARSGAVAQRGRPDEDRPARCVAAGAPAGELEPIYVPDERDEAMRDLVRAREDAVCMQRQARQRLQALLLRNEIRYAGRSSWTRAHRRWIPGIRLPDPAQQIAFEDRSMWRSWTITEGTSHGTHRYSSRRASRRADQGTRHERSRAGPADRVPTNRITGILNGRRAITGDSALRLAHFFGTTPEFWLNLQKLYELRLAEAKAGAAIRRLPRLGAKGGSRVRGSQARAL